MSERQRIWFLAGCLFVIGLNLRSAERMIFDGWFGPYAAEPTVQRTEPPRERAEVLVRADTGVDGSASDR